MTKMDIMKLPNKETSYFCKNIDPWIAKKELVDRKKDLSQVTFKKDVPIDVINKFLICRPKLTMKFIREYKIEK